MNNLEQQIEEDAKQFAIEEQSSLNGDYKVVTAAFCGWREGAKSETAKAYHTQGMYSEKEVMDIIDTIDELYRGVTRNNILGWEWFNENKKK